LALIDDALERKTYSQASLEKQKYKILLKTYMNREARLLSFQVGTEEADKAKLDRQEETAKKLSDELKASSDKLMKLLTSQEFANFVAEGSGDKKAFVKTNEITGEDLQAVFDYSKFLYESGQYDQSSSILSNYMHVCKPSDINAVMWGLLNSQIMGKMYKNLEPTFNYLKDLILREKSRKNDNEKLIQKNMLLNTAMFVFPHVDNPGKFLYNLYSVNENIVTSMSPHLHRYYVVAALLQDKVVTPSLNDSYQELFLTTLLEEFDFENSFEIVTQVSKACHNDYFLKNVGEQVSESCSKLIISTYAKIHDTINVNEFSKNLGKSSDDGVKFVQSVLEKEEVAHKLSADGAEIKLTA
jgi:hypothetical protein